MRFGSNPDLCGKLIQPLPPDGKTISLSPKRPERGLFPLHSEVTQRRPKIDSHVGFGHFWVSFMGGGKSVFFPPLLAG